MNRIYFSTMKRYCPLIGFVAPTLIIGYGYVIPASCIAGVNEHTVGFAATIAGACIAYWLGLRAAIGAHRASSERSD